MRRGAAFKPDEPMPRERRIVELLSRLRFELRRRWELSVRSESVDDDLLPAQQQIENALVAVDIALDRARTGEHGCCSNCGGPIDFERLLAHPAATTCWPCQVAAEEKRRSEISH